MIRSSGPILETIVEEDKTNNSSKYHMSQISNQIDLKMDEGQPKFIDVTKSGETFGSNFKQLSKTLD